VKTAKYFPHLYNIYHFPILSCLKDHDHTSHGEQHLPKGPIFYAADVQLIAELSGTSPVTIAIPDTCKQVPAPKRAAAKWKQVYAQSGSESQAKDKVD
jgi:hypothetical protein